MLLSGFPSSASTCSFGASSPSLGGNPDSSLLDRQSSSSARKALMASGTCAHVPPHFIRVIDVPGGSKDYVVFSTSWMSNVRVN